MREVEWKPFDISKYVNYERDGYEFIGRTIDEYCPWELGFEDRYWHRTCGNIEYRIVETDVQAHVDYIVKHRLGPNSRVSEACRLRHVGRISWERRRNGDRDWIRHRDDGPAFIRINQHEKLSKTEWLVNGVDISADVRPWIKAMGYPAFYNWTTEHKMMFKLAFG